MKIGVFGGRFDPIHLGHLLLAETTLRQCALDRIIFVPTGVSPHKNNANLVSGEDRIEMINLAISGYEEYSSSRFEIDSPEVSYTVNTLRHFKETMLDPDLYLILGADMFNDLPHWYQTEEICRLCIPIVACRPDFPLHISNLFHNLFRSSGWRCSIHSWYKCRKSNYRQRKSGIASLKEQSIRFQVPRQVETYIHTHNLYNNVK